MTSIETNPPRALSAADQFGPFERSPGGPGPRGARPGPDARGGAGQGPFAGAAQGLGYLSFGLRQA